MKKMLLVFAHPDDETFTVGGTVAAYAASGWHVECILATGKDERAKEAERAGKLLGIQHIQFLDKPDGELQSVTPGTLEDLIVKKMEEYLPDVVITHDTTGIDNHPDHIKVCYATTFAFQKYVETFEEIKTGVVERKGRGYVWKEDAFKRAFGDVNPENIDPKLYYACMPTSVVGFMQKSKFIAKESYGLPVRGTADKFVTTVIDIKDTKLTKGKALLCYESQKEKVEQFISFDKNPQHNQEWFVLRMQGIHEVFMGKNDRVADEL
jgi:LmbE family N-acetylglucosaminyl deacetylase